MVRKLAWSAFLVPVLTVLSWGTPCRAGDEPTEDGDPDVTRLEEVVVTAPPVIEGNRVNDLASQVTVVTEEQIRNLNAQCLPSALRRVPGVVISRHNPVGSFGGGEGGAIFIRGHGASRPGSEISMLVDGIPKFVSVWTHPLMDVLSVDVIQSVDVYKAPQPVLFGNMAFAAVNMKTKRMTEEGTRSRLRVAYGSYDTFVGVAEHGGRVGGTDYYVLGSYRRSDGHRTDADGELGTIYARVGTELSDAWSVGLTFLYTDNYANDPGSLDPDTLSQGKFATTDSLTVLTVSNHSSFGEGHVKFYWDRGDIDWTGQDESSGLDTFTDYDNYGVRLRETFRPWPGGSILAGFDLDYVSGDVDFGHPDGTRQSFERTTFCMAAPYIAVSHRFETQDGWYVVPSAGVRYIAHREFENEWGPQAGVIVGHGDTEMHAYCARGINYPGLYVKVQNDVFLPGENFWEDLRAETLDHIELGIAHSFGTPLEIDLTGFYDEGRDRIVVSPPPPFPPVLTNIGDYTIQGVEGTLTWAPLEEVSIFAGATWLDVDPSDLPYTPEWTASAGLNWRFLEGFQLSLDALWVDEHHVLSRSRMEGTTNLRTVDSYFLLNGRLSYRFGVPGSGTELEAWIAGENLTDTDYEMKPGYPMPGASVMVGLDVSF